MSAKNDLRMKVSAVLDEIPIDFGGGCSFRKAYMFAYLIRRFDMKNTLDIGVYRGRSLLPQAVAHKYSKSGMVYGVDPWDAIEAVEHDNTKIRTEIEEWASVTDFQAIYEEVRRLTGKFDLSAHCTLLRQTSEEAISYFREKSVYFDMMHIDGNHDTNMVMKDLDRYLPLLSQNGFVVLDDISWESVRPAYDSLCETMTPVFELIDGDANDYAIFWKYDSSFRPALLKARLKKLS